MFFYWAKGVNVYSNLDVNITEPDASPLQLQGPKSKVIMESIFGSWINELKYYWHKSTEFNGIPLIISRTGWSSELGYEIFLRDSSRGDDLWEMIMTIGKPLGLFPGHTSTIRRIEGAMLSYVADMNINNNPYELGLSKLIDLEMDFNFIGKSSLKKIERKGVDKILCGFEIFGPPFEEPNDNIIPIFKDSINIGNISSAVYSPRLNKNIGVGIIDIKYSNLGSKGIVSYLGSKRDVKVIPKPFYDPKKKIAIS